MSIPRAYLGDGVYLSFDGYSLRVAVNNHLNEVAVLEPEVFLKFVEEGARMLHRARSEQGYDFKVEVNSALNRVED